MRTTVSKLIPFFDRVLLSVEFSTSFLGLLLIVFLVYVGIARYFFQTATPYEEEFSLLIHLWMVNLGMSLVIRQGDHVATKILYDRVATLRRIGRVYRLFVELLKISFIVLMLWFLYQTFPLLTRAVTEYMRWPFAAYYSAIVAGLMFMLVRYILQAMSICIGDK
ncbi:MAG: TRAP transporter small permease subunit [Sulfolobales archaeon]